MRLLYAARQAALIEAAQQLPDWLDVRPAEAGMHVLGWLPAGSDDQAIAQLAAQHDVTVLPLSRHRMEPSAQRAVLLGYAAVPIPAIQAGVDRLVSAFSRVQMGR